MKIINKAFTLDDAPNLYKFVLTSNLKMIVKIGNKTNRTIFENNSTIIKSTDNRRCLTIVCQQRNAIAIWLRV